jgi:hypothetical protein
MELESGAPVRHLAKSRSGEAPASHLNGNKGYLDAVVASIKILPQEAR